LHKIFVDATEVKLSSLKE